MADLAGGLNIALGVREGRVWAEIRSSRPLGASAVFAGRSPAETAVRLPALYSICATAQAVACTGALEAALGQAAPSAVAQLRALLVDAETVKAHLWRILLDWPRLLGEPPDAAGMGAVMRAYTALRAALIGSDDPLGLGAEHASPDPSAASAALAELAEITAELVFGLPPGDWLAATVSAQGWSAWERETTTRAARLVRMVLERGWEGLGLCPVGALAELTGEELEPWLGGTDAERFIAAPTWKGAARETSAFTRQRLREPVAGLTERYGNGLLPRLAATLVEVAERLDGLRCGLEGGESSPGPLGASPSPGVGIALVPAARGLLVHRAAVGEDRVTSYRILAPTEWNFHPQGVLAQGLAALPASDAETLRVQAGLLVTAIDPCVDYHIALS
jgi:hypothetical protein